jgi:hypothetical protein
MIKIHTASIDRKKVPKHHPDKKAGSGDTNDDALFKCIQKGDFHSQLVASCC